MTQEEHLIRKGAYKAFRNTHRSGFYIQYAGLSILIVSILNKFAIKPLLSFPEKWETIHWIIVASIDITLILLLQLMFRAIIKAFVVRSKRWRLEYEFDKYFEN